jgi:hypothetical protein
MIEAPYRTHARYDDTSLSLPGGHPRALRISSREDRGIKYCLQQSSVAAQMSTSALGNPSAATAVAMDRAGPAGTESGGGGALCHAHSTPSSGPHTQAKFRNHMCTASGTMGLGAHRVCETQTKPTTDHAASVIDNGQASSSGNPNQ